MEYLTFLVFLHSSKFMSIHKFSSTTLYDFKCMDCFFKYEAQISRPYPRWGLTNTVESFWKSGPSRYHKLQRTKRTTTFVEIYSSHFKSTSRIISRSFCSKTYSNSSLWNVTKQLSFECERYENLKLRKCKMITLLKW